MNKETKIINPKIAIGVSSFKELVLESDIIVDKSLFIQSFLDSPGKVNLVTRPRRWGKSLNLSMLKTFFEIEVYKQGKPLPFKQRLNLKLFLGGEVVWGIGKKKVLSPLKIAKDNISMLHQGQYPVILIDLKDIKGDNYQEIKSGIIKRVRQTYSEHKYLINSKELTPNDKKKFQDCLNEEINESDLEESLYFLSELLYTHFNRTVFILIDEYDSIINNSYWKLEPSELEKLVSLLRVMLGRSLKGNTYLEKGLLTGILRIAKTDLFSSLNNVSEYTLLDERFTEFYGFSQEEIDELLTHFPQVDGKMIKDWYNGYIFGGQTIYNPWSIVKCLSEGGKFDTYWMDTGGTGLIDKTLLSDKVQTDLQTLLENKSIERILEKKISLDQIRGNTNTFYSLLLFSGYLNAEKFNDNPEDNRYYLTIPNKEVLQIYRDRVIQWIFRKLNVDESEYKILVGYLVHEEINKFITQLKEDLLCSSYSDLIQERDYHNLMNGILLSLRTIYEIMSNRESGYGRPDHVLVSRQGDIAFILEYKFTRKEEEMSNLIQVGLDQIETKKYNTVISERPQIQKLIKIALVFCGKKVEGDFRVEFVNNKNCE